MFSISSPPVRARSKHFAAKSSVSCGSSDTAGFLLGLGLRYSTSEEAMMSREDVETTKVLERILIAVSHVDLLVPRDWFA